MHVCLAKPGYNDGKFWSHQVTINIPLDDPEHYLPNSGVFVGGPDSEGVYYLKGKRHSCKMERQ